MHRMEAEKLIHLARQISDIVASPTDLQRSLEATVGLVRSVMNAQNCSIMLLDETTNELFMAASSDIPRELWPTIRKPLGEGFAGKVARTGRPLLVREAESVSQSDNQRQRRYSSQSFICVPMKLKGRVVGVINVTNRRDRQPFTHEQLDVVVSLANLVALAVENARLLSSTETMSRRLHDVLEGLGDGVIAVDTNREILHHNQIALRYLGLEAGQCVGRRLDDVVPGTLADVFKDLHERTLQQRDHIHEEVQWPVRGSSPPVPVTLSTTPLYHNARGKLSGVVFVIHDVSLHHQLDELRRIDEAKNNFLAIVSHELRTPLTSIKAGIHLLRERLRHRLDQETAELFRIIENNSERLLRQIVNLLDVVNIENQTASLTLRRTVLSELASRCIERIRPEAERKEIALAEHYSNDPEPILIDEEKIERAVAHLVDNAVKFTPRGGSIAVYTGRADGEAFIAVADTGPGIDPGMRERLFQKFVQGEGPLTRQSGGCGVGLYVARAFAELHGGRIEVSNRPQGGCEFRILLPIVSLSRDYSRQGAESKQSPDSRASA